MSGQPPNSRGEGNKITNDGRGDDIRKASLAVRVEDAVKALDELAIDVICHYKKEGNGAWKNVAHKLDNCNSDLRLWQYDVSTPITVPGKTKGAGDCQGSRDLSAYDVLEILEAQCDRDTVCEKISGALHKLEQGLVGFRRCFAKSSSIPDPDKHDRTQSELKNLRASIAGLNALKSEMQTDLTTLVDKMSEGNDGTPQALFKRRQPSVLSFDGGGVRSLSSFLILKELMELVAKYSNELEETLLPRDIFDYLFGSSSGGLAAIMLGRLKMTVPLSIEKFEEHAQVIFNSRTWKFKVSGGLIGPKYAADRFSRSAWSVVREADDRARRGEKWKLNMFAAPWDNCKTAVLVKASYMPIERNGAPDSGSDSDSNSANDRAREHSGVPRDSTPQPRVPAGANVRVREQGQQAYFLRTYDYKQRGHGKDGETDYTLSPSTSVSTVKQNSGDVASGAAATCEIWEAARATSAAPYYFPTIRINDLVMHDGGFGLNNPSVQALSEVVAVEGSKDRSVNDGVFVSIGTGGSLSRTNSFKLETSGVAVSVALSAVDAATDTRPVHNQMCLLAPQLGFTYFRFDVPGMGDIELDDWKAMQVIRKTTKLYLERDDIKAELEKCARRLVENRRPRK